MRLLFIEPAMLRGLLGFFCLIILSSNYACAVSGWPIEVQSVKYLSSGDSTLQPALFYAPDTNTTSPLLVGLHTWSGDYLQTSGASYASWCIRNEWIFIYPNFRGPNNKPEATGSELVVADIVSAVDYAKANANVDMSRIYLVGASGGGHAALLMAGRSPHIWAGVSSWVPISDLEAWYFESKSRGAKYANDIVQSTGGVPGASAGVDLQYKSRSPITHLGNATAPLDINAGINDGHTGSVPISHSLNAFNLVASPADRLSEDEIKHFVEKTEVPPHLKEPLSDATYGNKTPLFRRLSRNVRVTIFSGGHEIVHNAALSWLAQQKKDLSVVPVSQRSKLVTPWAKLKTQY